MIKFSTPVRMVSYKQTDIASSVEGKHDKYTTVASQEARSEINHVLVQDHRAKEIEWCTGGLDVEESVTEGC